MSNAEVANQLIAEALGGMLDDGLVDEISRKQILGCISSAPVRMFITHRRACNEAVSDVELASWAVSYVTCSIVNGEFTEIFSSYQELERPDFLETWFDLFMYIQGFAGVSDPQKAVAIAKEYAEAILGQNPDPVLDVQQFLKINGERIRTILVKKFGTERGNDIFRVYEAVTNIEYQKGQISRNYVQSLIEDGEEKSISCISLIDNCVSSMHIEGLNKSTYNFAKDLEATIDYLMEIPLAYIPRNGIFGRAASDGKLDKYIRR